MITKTAILKKGRVHQPDVRRILEDVLHELKDMRRDITLLLPHEHVKEYAHPKKIETSLKNAMRMYPPQSV